MSKKQKTIYDLTREQAEKLPKVAADISIIFAPPPQNKEQSAQLATAMAKHQNYPVGLDGCFTVGISGGCGPDCWVFLDGDCTEPGEILADIEDENERVSYIKLYNA